VLGVEDASKVLEGLTDDQCADFILEYLWKLRKDRDFKRILLRMVERDGIRETVRGLL
jgi:hypothetical protein